MDSITFGALRQANNTRQEEWPGNDKIDLGFRVIEVGGESGEAMAELADLLTNAILGLRVASKTGDVLEKAKKTLRAERGIKGSTATLEDVADEMADAIISLDLLAADMGIDLGEAVARKFNRTSEKYGLQTRLTEDPDLLGDALNPMDNAPTDGTEVLLLVESRAGIPGKYLVGHYMPGGHCIEDHPAIDEGWYFWNGCMFDMASKPIGWRELPETETS
jgi:NTP pyrophosphatase (non-canonical NTP hydrolase)